MPDILIATITKWNINYCDVFRVLCVAASLAAAPVAD